MFHPGTCYKVVPKLLHFETRVGSAFKPIKNTQLKKKVTENLAQKAAAYRVNMLSVIARSQVKKCKMFKSKRYRIIKWGHKCVPDCGMDPGTFSKGES